MVHGRIGPAPLPPRHHIEEVTKDACRAEVFHSVSLRRML
jgi:hypothetical protein